MPDTKTIKRDEFITSLKNSGWEVVRDEKGATLLKHEPPKDKVKETTPIKPMEAFLLGLGFGFLVKALLSSFTKK